MKKYSFWYYLVSEVCLICGLLILFVEFYYRVKFNNPGVNYYTLGIIVLYIGASIILLLRGEEEEEKEKRNKKKTS